MSATNNLSPDKKNIRQENWLDKFLERLPKSTKFDGSGRLYVNTPAGKTGLTKFYLILTLKTQLEK